MLFLNFEVESVNKVKLLLTLKTIWRIRWLYMLNFQYI